MITPQTIGVARSALSRGKLLREGRAWRLYLPARRRFSNETIKNLVEAGHARKISSDKIEAEK